MINLNKMMINQIENESNKNLLLHHAITDENEAKCLYLIETGIRLTSIDEDGNTPLLLSVVLNLPKLAIKILSKLKLEDINTRNNEKKTALHFAAENNNFELLKFLISKGCDLKAVDKDGWTILHSAAAGVIDEGGNWDVIELLLSYNLDITPKDKDGKTARDFFEEHSTSYVEKYNKLLADFQLLEAIKNGDIQKLEESGTLEYSSKYGDSLLHHAIRAKNLDIVKFLITGKGININIESKHGDTPLHLAVLNGEIGLVKGLLEMGADPNAKSSIIGTPMSLAIELGQKEIFKELISHINTDTDIKQLFNSAARGIIDNNQYCWEIIKDILKDYNDKKFYQDAYEALMAEHWLYSLKFNNLVTNTFDSTR